MAKGSVLFDVWDALLAKLAARGGLAGVAIDYALDDRPIDLDGEHIWIGGGAATDSDQALISEAPVTDDEFIDFPLHIQVIDYGSDQRTVDRRCQELFAEVQQEMATDRRLGMATTAEYQVLWVRPVGFDLTRGPLPVGEGGEGAHGARFDVTVRIRSRIK